MNKNTLIALCGIALLVILGYFALNTEEEVKVETNVPNFTSPMGAHGNGELVTVIEEEVIPFNTLFNVDDQWTIKVIQFEPDARLSEPMGSGKIESGSDVENNPAIKVEFYKDGNYEHYQICFKNMKGIHSKKSNQKYFVDLLDYKNMEKTGDGNFVVESTTVKINEAK